MCEFAFVREEMCDGYAARGVVVVVQVFVFGGVIK